MSTISILLVDDHELVRAGLRALLESRDDFQVVAEASDGREAIRLAELHRPAVVLMDLMMPGLNGLEATSRIARTLPDVGVLIVSMNAGEEFVLPAIRAGARGYVLKSIKPAELDLAIRATARGETYLSPAVSGFVVKEYCRLATGEISPLDQLTPRQREVLQLVAEGRTSKEIAKQLGLTAKSVETYRSQLMETLDIHDVASLTRFAIRVGLVSPES